MTTLLFSKAQCYLFSLFFYFMYFVGLAVCSIESLTWLQHFEQTGMFYVVPPVLFFLFSPVCDMAQGRWTKWLWQIGNGNDKIGYLISMVEGIGLWCRVHLNKQTVWTPPGPRLWWQLSSIWCGDFGNGRWSLLRLAIYSWCVCVISCACLWACAGMVLSKCKISAHISPMQN